MYIYFIIALVLSFILTVLAERILIPILKSVKMEQKILEIGPRWHKSKEGTPTMGGIGFIIPAVIIFIVLSFFAFIKCEDEEVWRVCITFVFAILCGAIGFIDDYAKFFKKQNEGLTAGNKYLLQLIAASLYLYFMRWVGGLDTSLRIPFFNVEWEMGVFYYIFALILITGVVNSVNLTDGIDGLAASVTSIVAALFAVTAFVCANMGAGVFSGIIIGCCVGFLVYNFYISIFFL